MVVSMLLLSNRCGADQLLHWQQQLKNLNIEIIPKFEASFGSKVLTQYQEPLFIVDEKGLWLAANGMRMQPDWVGQLARLKRASHKNELIARACQTEQQPVIIDATAGLGHDGLLLAWLGAKVNLIERHPVLFALLSDAYQTAMQHPALAATMQRVQLVHGEASDYLAQMQRQGKKVDVVYLDPMFPKGGHKEAKKQAQVKKEMQILHYLLPDHAGMDLGEYLLPLAKQVAPRVIIKRPRHAAPLTADMPQHQWLGDACRFDGYFQPALQLKNSQL
ncbi:class I SAM-dependent methyltransferase [Alkanindiges sp. WGS2144]|uniref:class I SAM-dependent methyltransferase n=1 Tax=Alkanindiges sp. WGS2144 TaxID=3366808 RepID=UPI0037538399